MNILELTNTHQEYVYTKILDIEDMNTRMVTRIDELGDAMEWTTNVKALTTHSTLNYQYPEFAEFSEIVRQFAIEASTHLNMNWPNHHARMNNDFWKKLYLESQVCGVAWGSKYESGDFANQHDHWPATWAWVYYIDPPKNAPGLHFPTCDYTLEIEHGMLVLFSGNLHHMVKKQEFDGDRYIIAGSVLTHPSVTGILPPPPEQ